MGEPGHSAEQLRELAQEIDRRRRHGEQPALAEYRRRYPHLGGELDALFSASGATEAGAAPGDATWTYLPGPLGGEPWPQRLGEYRILRELGRGGMGVVYEAIQEPLGRHVALKVLPAANRMEPTMLERFRREAQAAARLHHTNIVPVFGVGEHEGMHFYAMQFIRGRGLDTVIRDLRRSKDPPPAHSIPSPGPPSLGRSTTRVMEPHEHASAEASESTAVEGPATSLQTFDVGGPEHYRAVARIGIQAAEALAYAHSQGLLHRDIKPANLLLDDAGTVWITDFGLAKAEGSSDLTTPGDVVGTLRFLAPERFHGTDEPRGDLYSLGLTLYELAALQPAFSAPDRAQLLERIRNTEPSGLRQMDARIPRDLETIIAKTIAKEPADRYATGQELAEDLRRFLADRPVLARRTLVPERLWRWCRRNPATATLLASIALLLVAGTAVSTYFAVQANNEARAANDARDETQRKNAELGRQLYRNGVALAYREWQIGNIGVAEQLLEGCPAIHRGWEWHYCRRLCHPELYVVKGFDEWLKGLLFSPDGKYLAASGDGGVMRVVHAEDGRPIWERRLAPNPSSTFYTGFNLAYSADGEHLAIGGWDGRVRIFSAISGDLVREIPARFEHVDSLAVSLDGSRLAVFSQSVQNALQGGGVGELEVWDPRTGRSIWKRADVPDRVPQLAFNRDGSLLAVARFTRGVELHDAATGRPLRTLTGHVGPVGCLAFSPDGARLVSGDCRSTDATLKIWDVATGKEVQTLRGHRGPVRSVAYSGDGKRIISGGEDYLVRIWDPASGRELYNLKGCVMPVMAVTVSPDGSLVAAGGLDLKVTTWKAVPDPEVLSMPAHELQFLVYHPKKRWVVAGNRGEVKAWDDVTGQVVRTLHVPAEGWAFSPDGKWFAAIAGRNVDPRAVRVGDWETGQEHILGRHDAAVTDVAFSPDGKLVASASFDKTVRVWDRDDGRELHRFDHDARIQSVAFSPDGRHLATCGYGRQMVLWDLVDGRKVRTFPAPGPLGRVLAFNSDGSRLVAGTLRGAAAIYDVSTGAELHRLKGHSNWIRALAFSPDGKRVVTGSSDQTIRIWDASTGEEVLSLRHPMGLASVVFSPDGQRLAACDMHTVYIRDAGPAARLE